MADQEQVQVRFTTTQQKYAVNDAPILVPSALKRFGLSEIVNNLLGHEKPVPFDFLIDGEILKTSLAQYLSEKLLSTENVITLEYLESMLPPTQLSTYEHDDWISSVKGHQGYFLTGSYDNQTRIWNTSNECIGTLHGPKDAVKTVAFGAFEGSSATIFAGSMDHTITAWKFNVDNHSDEKLYECKGHKGPVEDIALNKSFDMLASASTDATIQLWSTSQEDTAEADTAEPTSGNKKRRKTEQTGQKIKVPKAALEGHVGTVSSVTFDPHDANTLYSGGWDHSIRVWSLDDQVNTVTKNCEKVVLAMDYSPLSRLVATGHTDDVVRLWDPRADDGSNVKRVLRGHTGWTSSVSWSPLSEHILCSGSYDGTVRVWDLRSRGALHVMQQDNTSDKIFGVCYDDNKILAGGESKKLTIYEAKII